MGGAAGAGTGGVGPLAHICLLLIYFGTFAALTELQVDLCGGEYHCGGFGISANAVVLVIQWRAPGHLINYCTAVMKYWNAHTHNIRITESQFR